MNFDCAMVSRRGRRPENEDFGASLVTEDQSCVACIADGVGGRLGGAVASRLSVELFVKSAATGHADLGQLLREIDQRIRREGVATPDLAGMSTTFTGYVISGMTMRWVHAGDSRLSILRGKGIRQLTADDTEVSRLYRAGKLTVAEAANYFRKNVLENALGGRGELVPRCGVLEVHAGDRLVLTTDGIHKSVSKREMRDVSLATSSASELCQRIADLAEENGTNDNLTVVAVSLDDLANGT